MAAGELAVSRPLLARRGIEALRGEISLMPSPFPGMDPFLEHYWGDVHASLTLYARDQLRPQLRDLRVRIEEHVGLEIDAPGTSVKQQRRPDVKIYERPESPRGTAWENREAGLAVAAEPLLITIDDPFIQRSVRITDRHSDRLVTVVEFLSPGNKLTREQRRDFHERQADLWRGGVNLVEIDLIRCGGWAMSLPRDVVPSQKRYPYRALVMRAESSAPREFYCLELRQALPTIRIPLRPTDSDAVLDLQKLISMAWENADYTDIDYATEPYPSFRRADDDWLRQILAGQGFHRSDAPACSSSDED